LATSLLLLPTPQKEKELIIMECKCKFCNKECTTDCPCFPFKKLIETEILRAEVAKLSEEEKIVFLEEVLVMEGLAPI